MISGVGGWQVMFSILHKGGGFMFSILHKEGSCSPFQSRKGCSGFPRMTLGDLPQFYSSGQQNLFPLSILLDVELSLRAQPHTGAVCNGFCVFSSHLAGPKQVQSTIEGCDRYLVLQDIRSALNATEEPVSLFDCLFGPMRTDLPSD